MSEWTIYGSNGVAKAVVKELELHDEWMAECFLTITVKSAAPIDFEVGDYIDYRGERYTINYDPTVLKKARRGSYGEGFTYDNIKFVAVQDEIVRCDFNDIVLSDNNMHYTMLPTFPFYCETVDDLLDRIQANLEELYPGGWILISPDKDKDRQRGLCVGRQQAFLDAYEEYIGSGTEFEYEKTGIALTADNNTCWDALKWVNERFELNFIVRGRVVIVGTAGVVTSRKFKYGKGNGLYELERISDSEQKIITRLRGYGAETNLPDRYYSEMNARPFFSVSEIDPAASTPQVISVLIDNTKFNNVFTNIIDEISGSQKIAVGECEMDGIEFNAGFELVNGDEGCTTRMLVGATGSVIISGEDIPSNPQSVIDALKARMEVGSRIIFNSGVNKKYVDSSHITYSATGLPDNMAINRLMLPGFPTMSLADWVEAHMDDPKVAAIVEEGFTFSDDVNRPYIDSPNKEIYGIRPSSIYFDGSGDEEDIHPSIEGMRWEGRAVDVVVSATTITDNGILPDDAKDSDRQFTITIPKAGFSLPDVIGDDSAIDMKNGMCGARSFKIKRVRESDDKTNWSCTCDRDYDDTLKLYFPYSDFQIRGGDNFVLTGIDLPDSYIEAASEKLFFACVDALRANHAPRYTFQPRIDELWMARQDDTAKASGGVIESLHDTLKAGDIFSFMDEDLGIDAKIIIDILTIKENGNNGIPTYEVTLRDEKVVSAIDKRLDKIQSIASSGIGVSARQTSSLISEEGSDLFLSKIYDDEAYGLIGFLKGAWFGTKQWMIDSFGNANLYDVTVNGLLKALNAMINNVRSTNYTGDGMLDTGWRITNEYQGTNSKATFDYLDIRKKAFFNELEIRKVSHIGGDFCLSPASGRIWRVEFYDGSGNLLGYDTYTVPWTLGGKLLLLFNKSLYNRYLGHKKQIQRKLTDAERRQVALARCYFYTDDGSTSTMLNWTVGAQARCQTFNIEHQMEYDGSSWKGDKVGNTYWWRYVSATGEKKMFDGNKHKYIDLPVDMTREGNAYEWADADSDLPSVNDQVVQFGHRTNTNLMHVIMLETTGSDAPAFKEYRGINSWSLDGKRKTKISPTTGTEMFSTKFHIETEYGDVLVPRDRGAWTNGMTCYYYDRVSYGGSLWLCIVLEGSSTNLAPGDETAAQRQVWLKQVEKGDKGEVSFKSTVFKRSATKPTKPTGGSFDSPVPSGWSDGIPSGTETIWATTRIFSSDGQSPQQSAWTDVQLMSDTESFDMEFSPVDSNPGTPTTSPSNWYDPTTDPSASWENMIWIAERTKSAGVWGAWQITRIKGEQGVKGDDGTDAVTTALLFTPPKNKSGASVIPTKQNYLQFNWSETIPTATEQEPDVYVGTWQYQAGTTLDITSNAPISISIFGHYGHNGTNGTNGKDGISVTINEGLSTLSYAISSYGVAGAGRQYPSDITSWSTTVPAPQQGKYLWTKDVTAYNEGTTVKYTTTYGVSYYGIDGDDVQIDSSRTFVKYSTQKTASKPADSTFTLDNPPSLSQGDYLWILSQTAYVGQTTALKSYSVSRVGTDGSNGDPGADGYTTHFAYATSADGSQNFSTTNFSGATYIGTYRDRNAADSTNYRDYTWTKWKGDTGQNGQDGQDGDDGANGTSIVAAPNAIIINQQKVDGGAQPLTSISYPIVVVARDGGTIVRATISSLTATNCTASITKNNATDATVTITAIDYTTDSGGVKRYKTSGAVAFHVAATTAAGQAFSADISVPFGCNLLGQYTLDIEEDVKTEVSSKVSSEIDSRNLVNVSTMNTTVQQSAAGLTTEINRVDARLNSGGDIATEISNTNSRVSTAEGNITNIKQDLYGDATHQSKYYTKTETVNVAQSEIGSYDTNTLEHKYSTISQTDQKISIGVSSVSQTAADAALSSPSTWEQGKTDGEQAGKTYDQIKVSSAKHIRTKHVMPIGTGIQIAFGTPYQVGILTFDADKKEIAPLWISYSTSPINIAPGSGSVPAGAVYVALIMKKTNGDDMTPDEVADAVTKGQLFNAGIDIDNKTITIKGDKVYFKNADGTDANINFDNTNGLYKIGGFFINSTSIGSDKESSYSDSSHIIFRNDGFLHINNTTANRNGLWVDGGVLLKGDATHSINLQNTNGTIQTLGKYAAIDGTTEVTIGNGSQNGFVFNSTSTTVGHSGKDTTVSGDTITLDGVVSMGSNCIFTSGTVALPTNAKDGQIIFAKGIGGDLTLTGNIIQAGNNNQVPSIGGDRKSRIMVFRKAATGDRWIEFNCE